MNEIRCNKDLARMMACSSKRRVYFLSLLLVALSLLRFSDATTLEYLETVCDNGNFVVQNETVACDGGACEGGDKLQVDGYLTINQDLPSSYTSLVKVCKFRTMNRNWLCFYKTRLHEDVWSKANVQGQNGAECGEAGEYSFDIKEQLPFRGDLDLGYGWKAYLEASIRDESSQTLYERCTVIFAASSSSNSGSFMMWPIVGAAPFLIWGSAVWRRRVRRRRALVTFDDMPAESEGTTASSNTSLQQPKASSVPFVELTDRGTIV